MKRTTLLLDDARLAELKRIAAAEERTLSAVIDEMLCSGITAYRRRGAGAVKIQLPVFAMGAARINVADRDQLEELMRE